MPSAAPPAPQSDRSPPVGPMLTAARDRLGLDLELAAVLLATDPGTLARIESGRSPAAAPLTRRVAGLAGLSPASAYCTWNVLSLATLGRLLAALDSPSGAASDQLRLIIQASDDYSALTSGQDRAFFLAEPDPTPDRRHEALLAALAVHLCRRAEATRTPAWTREPSRYLDTFWWFGLPDGPSGLRAYNFQRTPSSFIARGIVFNGDNLASV